jgi:hypothetical protein
MPEDVVYPGPLGHNYPKEHYNIWEDNGMALNRTPLGSVISLEGLKYGSGYRQEELDVLQPRLEALGYTEIEWGAGESDSFGPLTRVCQATNTFGVREFFFYG